MVCNLDETSKSHSYSESLQSTVFRWISHSILKNQNNCDKDSSADDLSEECLPILTEAVIAHVVFRFIIGVLWSENRYSMGGNLPIIVDIGTKRQSSKQNAHQCSNQLRSNDKRCEARIFLPKSGMDINANSHRWIKVPASDPTEDDDHGEESERYS